MLNKHVQISKTEISHSMQIGPYIRGSLRLSSDERREAIVEAVRAVFAKKGFERTTSRELAKAARVSEALLYKYFPTKLSLYEAMLDACAETPIWSNSNGVELRGIGLREEPIKRHYNSRFTCKVEK